MDGDDLHGLMVQLERFTLYGRNTSGILCYGATILLSRYERERERISVSSFIYDK